jgi:hypothetical protein
MKINKKNNIHIDSNESNLQNNQRKDYLKNLNYNVQNNKGFFFSKKYKDVVVINKMFKRSMLNGENSMYSNKKN